MMSLLTLPSLDSILIILTVIATAVMAASAALQGVRQGFDPFGTTVLAVVTAVGGGTFRDMLVGSTPVFWLNDMTYLSVAIPIGLLTYFLGSKLEAGGGHRLTILLYLDAIGLALFTLVGVEVALAHELSFLPAVILGCTTGVVGGMLRDLLCGQQPVILKQDLYATISLLGGGVFIIALNYTPPELSLTIAFLFMVIFRFIVIFQKRKAT